MTEDSLDFNLETSRRSSDDRHVSRRQKRLGVEVFQFLDQYGRKKRPGSGEPNDRKYDRKIENTVKRMDPQELDELLRDDPADEPGTLL